MGQYQIDVSRVHTFICTCIIIGAKFEQNKRPKFDNIIGALFEKNGSLISREDITLMEQEILLLFGFDFNFASPLQFM